eukprot:9489904-Pyramimonas_sp.AAC.1
MRPHRVISHNHPGLNLGGEKVCYEFRDITVCKLPTPVHNRTLHIWSVCGSTLLLLLCFPTCTRAQDPYRREVHKSQANRGFAERDMSLTLGQQSRVFPRRAGHVRYAATRSTSNDQRFRQSDPALRPCSR